MHARAGLLRIGQRAVMNAIAWRVPMSKASMIRKLLSADPEMRNRDIVSRIGCSSALVTATRKRMGLSRRGSLPPAMSFMSKENAQFVAEQSLKMNVPVTDTINAIVTDARMEDQA